jgi:hypothetical protein
VKKCGDCQWLDTPTYKDVTCRNSQEKTEASDACVEFTTRSDSHFGDIVLHDKCIRDLSKAVKKSVRSPDTTILKEIRAFLLTSDKIQKEFKSLIPGEYTTREALEELINAFKSVMVMRDRTMEVRLGCVRPRAKLIQMQEQLTAYVLKYHGTQLAKFKTAGDRDIILRGIIPELHLYKSRYDSIIETCDLVLESLKDTHFSLVEVEKLATICYEGRISNIKAEH